MKKSSQRIPNFFRELGDDAFFINSECVFTKNQILVKNRVYEILDFLNKGKIHINHVKLLHAYLKGFKVFIVGLDIVTGEVLYRHHRLGNEITVCDWLIIDLDFFKKEVNENLIRFSCKRKQPINDTAYEKY